VTLSVTIIGFVIGLIIKLAQMRKDLMRKMIRVIGKGKMMDLLLRLNKMTDKVSMDKLDRFFNKFEIEVGMEDMADDLKALLSVGKALHEPSTKAAIAKYKESHDYGVIGNKKRWNQIRHDPGIDKALGALVEHIVKKYHDQVMNAQEKGNVAQIKQLIANITSDDNVIKNREKRKKLERFNDMLRAKEKDIDLKRIAKELHEIFKVK
jgi:ribosome-binding protein aMBF1 (putative translation factor)